VRPPARRLVRVQQGSEFPSQSDLMAFLSGA
jgi:hypothetical protein